MPPRLRRKVAHDENSPAPAPAQASALTKRPTAFISTQNAHTSTPARPINAPRRSTRAAKPVKQTLTSPLPPSSPPFSLAHGYGLGSEAFDAPAAETPGDDPFGFLAAERRLKERKRILGQMQMQVKLPAPQDEDKGEDGEEGGMDIIDASFAPHPSDSDLELDLSTFVSGMQTPPGHTPNPRAVSPRHRRPKRKEIPPPSPASPSPSSESGSKYVSIPGTPSPMKRLSSSVSIPRHRRRRPLADVGAAARVNSPLKPAERPNPRKNAEKDVKSQLPSKRKGKKGGKAEKGGKGEKADLCPPRKKHKTDETLAEEELRGVTDALKELLPHRPTRKVAQRKSMQPRDANVQSSAARATKSKANSKSIAKKGKQVQNPLSKNPKERAAKRKNVDDDGDGSDEEISEKEGESFVLSGEEREQFEVDREKRQEYFREVDEYVMSEESVYVI